MIEKFKFGCFKNVIEKLAKKKFFYHLFEDLPMFFNRWTQLMYVGTLEILESRLVRILSNLISFISHLYFSYYISDHLPRYLWGPPPPYSQPPSIENIREASEINADLDISGSAITGNNNPTGNTDLSGNTSGNGCPLSLPVQPNSGPASVSGSARTTR